MKRSDDPRRARSLRQVWQYLTRRYFWRSRVARSAWIHATASVDRTHPAGIEIGEDVWIGPYAMVLSHDMSRGLYARTVIGARSVIGARAVVMPGVKVGLDCIVAPGCVVSRDIPSGEHIAGNPARIVRSPD